MKVKLITRSQWVMISMAYGAIVCVPIGPCRIQPPSIGVDFSVSSRVVRMRTSAGDIDRLRVQLRKGGERLSLVGGFRAVLIWDSGLL